MRIDARISPFKSSCVHRFLISSPDLLIDARGEWFRLQQLLRQRCSASDSILRSRKEEWFRLQRLSRQRSSASESNFRRCKEEWPACRGRRGNDLSHLILIFVAAKKNGSPCSGYRTTRSAADSILRSCKEEWLACIGRSGDDLPRLILIFVAAEKNGSACSGCRDNDLPRLILIFVAAKKNGPPAVHPQRQLKSRLRLVRCCSDSGFHGVNLGITAGFCLFTPSCVQ